MLQAAHRLSFEIKYWMWENSRVAAASWCLATVENCRLDEIQRHNGRMLALEASQCLSTLTTLLPTWQHAETAKPGPFRVH